MRQITENEGLHTQLWDKAQESDKAIQLLRDKIHTLTNEIRELHESDDIKQKMWEEQKRELRAAKEDSDRQWSKAEDERARTASLLADTKAELHVRVWMGGGSRQNAPYPFSLCFSLSLRSVSMPVRLPRAMPCSVSTKRWSFLTTETLN